MTQSEMTDNMVKFILSCPDIKAGSLYFNFAEEKDGIKHLVRDADYVVRNYIDGSQTKYYTFTIISYVAVAHNPLIDEVGFSDENMENLADIQKLVDWVDTQDIAKNYPDFGTDKKIDSMAVLTVNPNLDSVNTDQNPPLAKYSFTVRIEYLDTAKVIFK